MRRCILCVSVQDILNGRLKNFFSVSVTSNYRTDMIFVYISLLSSFWCLRSWWFLWHGRLYPRKSGDDLLKFMANKTRFSNTIKPRPMCWIRVLLWRPFNVRRSRIRSIGTCNTFKSRLRSFPYGFMVYVYLNILIMFTLINLLSFLLPITRFRLV